MTKDWDSVEAEIRELYARSNGKMTLVEIEKLMERKKFRASTRAYRMKLKEWGLLKQKSRRGEKRPERTNQESVQPEVTEPVSVEVEPMNENQQGECADREHCTRTGGWQLVQDVANAETTFMGLLHQTPATTPTIEQWAHAGTTATDAVMDMLGAILDNDPDKLQALIMHNKEHINDPIGMPFETPDGRFFGHPIMNQMVIMQHPNQTLLDVTSGMPCGASLWVLVTQSAKGTHHPLDTELALHNAIKNGRTMNVRVLARPGRLEVNGLPGTSWKPLLQAVYWNHPEVVSILIRRGANLEDAAPSPHGTGEKMHYNCAWNDEPVTTCRTM
ncbi:hypothetical protein ACEQ8H_002779 [Pleosporales sp. CAS-2024a]